MIVITEVSRLALMQVIQNMLYTHGQKPKKQFLILIHWVIANATWITWTKAWVILNVTTKDQ